MGVGCKWVVWCGVMRCSVVVGWVGEGYLILRYMERIQMVAELIVHDTESAPLSGAVLRPKRSVGPVSKSTGAT